LLPSAAIVSGSGPTNWMLQSRQTSAKCAFSARNVGDLGGGDQRGDVEVGLRPLPGTDADRLVRLAQVDRVRVGLGVDRDRLDAELAAGAQDALRDLAAVGDQDSSEHGARPVSPS